MGELSPIAVERNAREFSGQGEYADLDEKVKVAKGLGGL